MSRNKKRSKVLEFWDAFSLPKTGSQPLVRVTFYECGSIQIQPFRAEISMEDCEFAASQFVMSYCPGMTHEEAYILLWHGCFDGVFGPIKRELG